VETFASQYNISSVLPPTNRATSFTLILTLSTAVLAGTGTAYTISQTTSPYFASATPIILVTRSSPASRNAAVIHHELLRHIRESLRLNMTELANVLGVSRTALYAWFQGSAPRPELLARLWQLNAYADRVSSLKISRLELLTKIPLSDGRTFLHALTVDENVGERIGELELISKSQLTNATGSRRKMDGDQKALSPGDITPSFSVFE